MYIRPGYANIIWHFLLRYMLASYMQIVMGDSNQLHNVEGRFQNTKEAAEYDTLNPDLVEEANYTIPISKTNTSFDRYKNEHKRKLFNSPILCLIPILIGMATLSVFIHRLMQRIDATDKLLDSLALRITNAFVTPLTDYAGMAAVNERPVYVNITLNDDRHSVWLSGSEFLPDGRLIVCDTSRHTLILLSSNFSIESSINLSSPFDVAVINDTTVAVTLPLQGQLQFVHVVHSLQLGTIFQLDMKCSGIDALNDTIYLICYNPAGRINEIRRLDFAGKWKEKYASVIYSSIAYRYYIAVSHVSGKIFISDGARDAIRCLSADGKSVYNYFDTSYPRSLLLDDLDNIVVCDWVNNSLQIIDRNGKKQRDLLTSANDLFKPRTLAYRKSDSTLVVGGDDVRLLVFKLSRL